MSSADQFLETIKDTVISVKSGFTDAFEIISLDTSKAIVDKGYVASHKFGTVAAGDFEAVLFEPTAPIHLRRWNFVSTAGPADTTIYEEPTVTDVGTPISTKGLDRRNGRGGKTDVYFSPTVTDRGEVLEASLIPGGNKTGGSAQDTVPIWILDPDKSYLLGVENVTTGDFDAVTFTSFWYY